MTVYSRCSDWALDQICDPDLSPDARLLLMILARDIGAGEPGATPGHLASQARMPRTAALRAIQLLRDRCLIEVFETEDGISVYAPKGWQE